MTRWPDDQLTRCLLDRVVRASVHAHISQGKAGSLIVGLNGNDVLVPLGSNLQFHRVTAPVMPTRHRLGAFFLAGGGFYVTAAPAAMALDCLSIVLQLFVVVGDDFVGNVLARVLRRYHFHGES